VYIYIRTYIYICIHICKDIYMCMYICIHTWHMYLNIKDQNTCSHQYALYANICDIYVYLYKLKTYMLDQYAEDTNIQKSLACACVRCNRVRMRASPCIYTHTHTHAHAHSLCMHIQQTSQNSTLWFWARQSSCSYVAVQLRSGTIGFCGSGWIGWEECIRLSRLGIVD